MKFVIHEVKNGFLLNITYSKTKVESFIFKPEERLRMLAKIDYLMGDYPPGTQLGKGETSK